MPKSNKLLEKRSAAKVAWRFVDSSERFNPRSIALALLTPCGVHPLRDRRSAGFIDGLNSDNYVRHTPWSAWDPNGLATYKASPPQRMVFTIATPLKTFRRSSELSAIEFP